MRVNRSISIGDIARKTGLSQSTVSRALRGRGEISERTRKIVERVARQLGYRPNLHVRAIQSGRTRIVGYLGIPHEEPLFGGRVFAGLHDTVLREGYMTIVSNAHPAEGAESGLALVYKLIDHRVDGLFFSPSRQLRARELVRVWDMHFPIIAIDNDPEVDSISLVATDDRAGGRLAAEHLLGLGHRRFLYVSAGSQERGSTSHSRYCGFTESIDQVAGTTCAVLVEPTLDMSRSGIRPSNVIDRLRTHPEITAVFAFNDWVAGDVYAAAAELGLRIPDDLSVIGFGNLAFRPPLVPSITTFEQSPYEIGQAAGALFLEMAKEQRRLPRAQRVLMPPALQIRNSTAEVRAR